MRISDWSSDVCSSDLRAAKIASWADRTTARAEREFRENREQWTRRQYGALLARDAERLVLQPPGATDDRKARLMRAAENMVHRNYAIRLAGINRAAAKLLAGRSEEPTSELQSLMRISSAVLCFKQ